MNKKLLFVLCKKWNETIQNDPRIYYYKTHFWSYHRNIANGKCVEKWKKCIDCGIERKIYNEF